MHLRIIVAGALVMSFSAAGIAQQKTLSLADALKNAATNYPSLKQKSLLADIGAVNQKMLDASLLPQVNVVGQATFQSEITSLELPGFPSGFGQKKDNYDVGVDVRLPLMQFGKIQTRRQLEQTQTELSISQIDIDIQRVREKVTMLFGNILLQKENKKILALRLKNLDEQEKKVAVGVNNGAVLKSNQLVLESEALSTQQRVDDINGTLDGLVKQLALFTNLPVDTATQLLLTELPPGNTPINRPELKVFMMQKHLLDLKSEMIQKDVRPNVNVFGQGYFGRPGYNFLNTKFRPYGIAGLSLDWNLNNLFNRTSQLNVVSINQNIIDNQKDVFNLNLQAALLEKQAEINKYQGIISKDDQIVKNRQEILRSTTSQLDNGAITSTEYLTELNALNTAQLNLLLHQVQLSIAKAQYLTLTGN